MRKNFTLLAALFLLLRGTVNLSFAQMSVEGNQVDLRIDPRVIEVGMFYRGTGMAVRAEVSPRCEGVAIKLQGAEMETQLNRKGRFAFLWLNVDKVIVRHAPRIYLLQVSEELPLLAPAEVLERWVLGYDAFRDTIQFESEKDSRDNFDDFIMLKQHEGAYSVKTARILHNSGDGRRYVSAELAIPPVISPGSYDVRLFCFADGRLIASGNASLLVEESGVPHLVKSLAYEHAAWYGILAIAVAITAGFGIGFLFVGRRR